MFAEEGCNVAICARDRVWLSKTEHELSATGVKTLSIAADVRKLEDIQRVVGTVIEAWGTIHVLVFELPNPPKRYRMKCGWRRWT